MFSESTKDNENLELNVFMSARKSFLLVQVDSWQTCTRHPLFAFHVITELKMTSFLYAVNRCISKTDLCF